ncbi:MAG TPA: Uma2 family endonuclease [Longimicrobium sp.]|nr:Uma2 family endonuclease [Longimicrobium sp.]
MATQPHLTTADELLRMPRDGVRRELVDGELLEMSPSGYAHGRVTANVTRVLSQHVHDAGLGDVLAAETGFKVTSNPDSVLAADVSFVRGERAAEMREERGYMNGAPDLAVEVVSPSDRSPTVEAKVRAWMSAGTRMVIVVHPTRRTVAVHRSGAPPELLGANDTLDGGDVILGWSVLVGVLFA